MISVGTAELKAVRRGETIARLELVIRRALGALQDVPLLGPSRSAGDVVEQLRQERAERP